MQPLGTAVAFCSQILEQLDKTILILVHVYSRRIGREYVHVPYLSGPPPEAAPQHAPLVTPTIKGQSIKSGLKATGVSAQVVDLIRARPPWRPLEKFSQLAHGVLNPIHVGST